MKTYRIKYQVEGGGLRASMVGSGFYRGNKDGVVQQVFDRWPGYVITILRVQRWSRPIPEGAPKPGQAPKANPQPTRRRP